MRRSLLVASVLFAGLLLVGRPTAAEWSPSGSRGPGLALGTGACVVLPFLVPFQDVSAELVLADRFAIGGKALFALGDPGEILLVPFVALGSPRSRPSAAYLAAAWLPRSTVGTLGLGYEAALRGPVRLYGEVGAVGAIGESSVLPYGHLGVRLRF
jgi:hypothetical protein